MIAYPYTNPASINPGITLRIGARGNESVLANTEIAEIIAYSSDQSGTNRQKIQSYLAVKYGITLTPGTATSYLASDGSTIWSNNPPTYQNNIIGIGQDNNSSLLQKQSTSVAVTLTSPYSNPTSYLTIAIGNTVASSNATNTTPFPNDKAFFIVGDNNASTALNSSSITANVNGTSSSFQKIARSWLINKTNWPDQSA